MRYKARHSRRDARRYVDTVPSFNSFCRARSSTDERDFEAGLSTISRSHDTRLMPAPVRGCKQKNRQYVPAKWRTEISQTQETELEYLRILCGRRVYVPTSRPTRIFSYIADCAR